MDPATSLPEQRPRFDHVDRELVLALQHDGRASYASLAAAVGMSQAGVRARVQRLLDSGAVHIAAVVDPFSFGFAITAMLGIIATGDLDAVADATARMEQVHFVVVSAGRYDCLAEVVCVDGEDLLALINRQIRAVAGVHRVEVLTYLRMVKHWQPEYLRKKRGDT